MGLFKAEKGKLLEPFKTEKGYVVVLIKDKKNPYIPSLKEVKDNITEKVITNSARQKAKEKAKKYLSKIKEIEKIFPEIITDLGLELQETPLLGKEQAAFTLGLYQEFEKYNEAPASIAEAVIKGKGEK